MRQLTILIALFISMLITSCSDEVQSEDNWKESSLCHQLIGTSWQQCSLTIHSKDGSIAYEDNDVRSYVYTFTNQEVNNEHLSEYKHRYVLEVYNIETKETKYGDWYLAGEKILYASCTPPFNGEVISLSSEYLKIRTDYDDNSPITGELDYSIRIFKSTNIGDILGSGNGNNNGNDNEGHNSTRGLLLKNNGYWVYDHSYSYVIGGNTQYARHNDYVSFTSNNEIRLHIDWQCDGKTSASFNTRKSIVDAWGTYRVEGEYLICEFSYVNCSGNSDLETQYWSDGVPNTKKYKLSIDGDLLLESGNESHRFNQDYISGGNTGNGGGSSNHHYPCKSCDESGKCWNCFGTGTDPITKKECNTCHGSGKCQICNGKGYFIV